MATPPAILSTTAAKSSGSATSFTIAAPATAVGQQLYLIGWTDYDGTAISFTPPAGWTLVARSHTQAQETAAATTASWGGYGRIYTRLSTSADVSTLNYTIGKASGRGAAVWCLNMDQACELDAVAWDGSATAATTATAPTATTSASATRVFRSFAFYSGTAVTDFSTPSGYTAIPSSTANAANYEAAMLCQRSFTTAAALGTAASTISYSSGSTRRWSALTLAVRALPTRRNLCTNPSFETNIVGVEDWIGTHSFARVAGSPSGLGSGSFSVRFGVASGQTYAYVSMPPTLQGEIVAGDVCAVSMYVRSTVSFAAGAVYASITWLDSTGVEVSTSYNNRVMPATPSSSTYYRFSSIGTAPANATAFRANFTVPGVAGATSSDLFYVDALLYEKAATIGAYFDGTFADSYWEGTAHGSPSGTAVVPIDLRTGTGWSAPLGLSAQASGARTSVGSGNARLGLATAAAGTATRQAAGVARAGLSARAAGPKLAAGVGWSPPIGVRTDGKGLKRGLGVATAAGVGLSGYAVPPPPVPQFTGRPLAEDPLPLAQSRYLVQNILTGAWLHTDLPLSDDQVTLTLSGPCEIAGKITPEFADLTAPGGGPLLRSWGHVVYLELDGEIRAAGLITEDSYDDQTQSITCRGLSAYPSVIAFQGAYRRYFADPLTVVGQLWDYVQGFVNGNLGVTVTRTGGVPPVLFGAKVNPVPGDKLAGLPYAPRPEDNEDDPPTLPVRGANTLPAVFQALLGLGYKPRTLADTTKPAGVDNSVPADTIFVKKADLERVYSDYFLRAGTGRTLSAPPDVTSSVTIDPYKVDWWDGKSVSDMIDEAVKALPADYVEQYGWNVPHTFVDQRVYVAYPRVGRRRDDLRFVQGENIVGAPTVESDPDGFATCVVGIGAGEGSDSLRETAEVILPDRARKTYTYRNPKITDRTVLSRIVSRELAERSTGGHAITSVVVQASHVNAPFGAYSVGDDIPLQFLLPHLGPFTQWSRITSMTLARGADLVQLNVKRSDAYYYGREVEGT